MRRMLLAMLTSLFQFTHPGKGATTLCQKLRTHSRVSIHAPWEGCDLRRGHIKADETKFQFTHPGKGATLLMNWKPSLMMFQFTHPGKGATQQTAFGRRIYDGFQFTHPGKGATCSSAISSYLGCVSIHAPWEGCDGGKRQVRAVR